MLAPARAPPIEAPADMPPRPADTPAEIPPRELDFDRDDFDEDDFEDDDLDDELFPPPRLLLPPPPRLSASAGIASANIIATQQVVTFTNMWSLRRTETQ
jgi:hypothetical protein